jgi:hypothetical protein
VFLTIHRQILAFSKCTQRHASSTSLTVSRVAGSNARSNDDDIPATAVAASSRDSGADSPISPTRGASSVPSDLGSSDSRAHLQPQSSSLLTHTTASYLRLSLFLIHPILLPLHQPQQAGHLFTSFVRLYHLELFQPGPNSFPSFARTTHATRPPCLVS